MKFGVISLELTRTIQKSPHSYLQVLHRSHRKRRPKKTLRKITSPIQRKNKQSVSTTNMSRWMSHPYIETKRFYCMKNTSYFLCQYKPMIVLHSRFVLLTLFFVLFSLSFTHSLRSIRMFICCFSYDSFSLKSAVLKRKS